MVYNPATDFLALWRNIAGQVSKVEIPGLDYVVAALARAGLITVSVSATAPVVNQSTTAWLQTAVPSNSAEGTLFLWNDVTSAYVAATPALFLDLLQSAAGESGAQFWTTAGGPPINTVGDNGDFAIRTDEPGGIYGPKAAGAWPANPTPGSTDLVSSLQLDNTFGSAEGQFLIRGASVWQGLPIGPVNQLITSTGVLPQWQTLSALFDTLFGSAQGDILYRDTAAWKALPPGTAGQILSTNGASANPSWVARTAEFPSGTIMLFQQTAAPTGWTKQVALNDYGLRVTSGTTGVTAGTAFSTVFAQSAVGNTTITQSTMPSHVHNLHSNLTGDSASKAVIEGAGGGVSTIGGGGAFGPPAIWSIDSIGSDGAHSHSIQLSLSYVDVIIAQKN